MIRQFFTYVSGEIKKLQPFSSCTLEIFSNFHSSCSFLKHICTYLQQCSVWWACILQSHSSITQAIPCILQSRVAWRHTVWVWPHVDFSAIFHVNMLDGSHIAVIIRAGIPIPCLKRPQCQHFVRQVIQIIVIYNFTVFRMYGISLRHMI